MAFTVKVRPIVLDGVRQRLHDLSQAEHNLAILLRDISEPYVPAHSGRLTSSARVKDNELSYNTPYAHRQYMGSRVLFYTSDGKPRYMKNKVVSTNADGSKNYMFHKTEFSTDVHPKAQPFWVYGARKDHAAQLRRAAMEEIKKELRR